MNLFKYFCNDYWEDFFIKSSPTSRSHLVTIDKKEGSVHCDCEDFKYRKENLRFGGVLLNDKENHCKHIQFALRIREVITDGET